MNRTILKTIPKTKTDFMTRIKNLGGVVALVGVVFFANAPLRAAEFTLEKLGLRGDHAPRRLGPADKFGRGHKRTLCTRASARARARNVRQGMRSGSGAGGVKLRADDRSFQPIFRLAGCREAERV